jgi:AraC family transcriptional regulator
MARCLSGVPAATGSGPPRSSMTSSAEEVTPSDIVACSSHALGWRDINVERDLAGACTLRLPQGAAQHLLVIHRAPGHVMRELGGEHRSCHQKQGDTVMIPAGVPVTWHFDRLDADLITLSPALLEAVAADLDGRLPARWETGDGEGSDALLAQALALLTREWRQGGENGHLYVEAVARVVARHVLQRFGAGQPPRPPQGRAPRSVLRAIDFLGAHSTRNPGLHEVAAAAGLNASHLVTTFRRATGVAPHQFLIRLRVERAQRLLRQGRRDASLSELSAELGFSDQSHFTRHFKRLTGTTPSAWRDGR